MDLPGEYVCTDVIIAQNGRFDNVNGDEKMPDCGDKPGKEGEFREDNTP